MTGLAARIVAELSSISIAGLRKKVNAMGKNQDTKKDVKKKPAKTIKEKRAEKKSKKETKG